MSSAYDRCKQFDQQRLHLQQAIPQQIPNDLQREQFNSGLRDGL